LLCFVQLGDKVVGVFFVRAPPACVPRAHSVLIAVTSPTTF
jgi:hypothetical protein